MQETTFQSLSSESFVSIELIQEKNFDSTFIIELIQNHKAFIRLENILEYKFKKEDIFLNSLTHSSFLNEKNSILKDDYERLEFLGDSFINMAITKMLIEKFTSSNEGELSKLRASLVNNESLYQLAKFIKLDHLVLVGRGEVKKNGMQKKSILADVFEAIFGVILIEAGFESAFSALNNLISSFDEDTGLTFLDFSRLDEFDYKGRLQEETMSFLNLTPEYRDLDIKDIDGGIFEVGLFIGDEMYCKTTSFSKKIARNLLAEKTYKEKKYINNEENYNVT